MKNNCYICVDIEAAGPSPSQYAMLSLGAATMEQPRRSFYAEFKPTHLAETAEAFSIHGLVLADLAETGMHPREAMESLEQWLLQVVPEGEAPIFVAFNAAFDWMFVNDYFHRFLGRNPFGHSALDIKALYMGMRGVEWSATSHRAISREYGLADTLPHHAEEDALLEVELFARMLDELEDIHPQSLKENLK